MSWYIYILLCDNKSFYVGLTSSIKHRFQSHKNKYNIGTKEFNKLELVYTEKYNKRLKAEIREKQIKKWSKAKKKALIEDNLELLKKLSKSRSVLNK